MPTYYNEALSKLVNIWCHLLFVDIYVQSNQALILVHSWKPTILATTFYASHDKNMFLTHILL